MQPEGFDFNQLMASAQQMQAQVQQAQASLAGLRVTGSAGGGLVRAQVDGNGQLVAVELDPSVVDPNDIDTLADLVVAAVRDGMREAETVAQREMSSVAGGLMGGLGMSDGDDVIDDAGADNRLAGSAGDAIDRAAGDDEVSGPGTPPAADR